MEARYRDAGQLSRWNGSSLRLDLDTLARLCQALDCTPGDLLVYVGEQQGKANTGQRK
ncbi:MAG: helix-turn-helix transcriptional regulator [Chloroflexales bacterium]|nr:helix-turn-helix transcriptional regulator [Chloroflexales bacterium]